MAISADKLKKEIVIQLTAYKDDVTDMIKENVRKAAEDCMNEIKMRSPVLTGSYKKGWRVREAFENNEELRMEIYNKTDGPLTHLLEYGHAGPGGIKKNVAAPRPHLRISAQNAEKTLEGKIKVGLR